jgi:hypothetical protein
MAERFQQDNLAEDAAEASGDRRLSSGVEPTQRRFDVAARKCGGFETFDSNGAEWRAQPVLLEQWSG